MLRIIAILFGIGFIFVGFSGFLPQFTTDGLLYGYFKVNFVHNFVFLVCGILAIMSATRYQYAKLFFQVIGIIFAVLAIAGFVLRGDLNFILMQTNFADNILHTCIAFMALYLGFAPKKFSAF